MKLQIEIITPREEPGYALDPWLILFIGISLGFLGILSIFWVFLST